MLLIISSYAATALSGTTADLIYDDVYYDR
jgi:hypothetical protein